MVFCADYDDKLLLNTAKLKTKLMPYSKNESVFHCPDTAHPDPYAFNDRLTGKTLASLSEPAKTVLIYEGSNGKLAFRHSGRAAIGFADGHAKLLNAEEAKNLIWKP